MAPASKILSHPDMEEIIEWITEGISVRDIESRLGQRYPKKKESHLRVSASTIQAFKFKHLKLNDKMLSDIQEHTRLAQKLVSLSSDQEEVEDTTAYQQAIAKMAETELHSNDQIIKVFYIVESRIEDLFNRVNEGEFLNKDADKLLQGYLDQFMKAFEQHKKYIEGHKDSADTNINITIMNDQMVVLREAIRETLSEIEPEVAMMFMSKLNSKMKDLVYNSTEETMSANATFLNRTLGAHDDA
jgi:hypothetical protein